MEPDMAPCDMESDDPLDMDPFDMAPPDADCASAEPATPKLMNRAKAAVFPKFFIALLLNKAAIHGRSFQLAGTGLTVHLPRWPASFSSCRGQDGPAGTGLDQHRIAQAGLRQRRQWKFRHSATPAAEFHQLLDDIPVRQGQPAILTTSDGNILDVRVEAHQPDVIPAWCATIADPHPVLGDLDLRRGRVCLAPDQ